MNASSSSESLVPSVAPNLASPIQYTERALLPQTPPTTEFDLPLNSQSTPTNERDRCVAKSLGRSRFSSDQDVAIVREVAAAKVHIAAFGVTRKRFEGAATKLHANPLLEFVTVS